MASDDATAMRKRSNSVPLARRGYTIQEAADVIGSSPNTVRRLIASGRLRTFRIGDRFVRVVVGDVARLSEPGTFTPLDGETENSTGERD